MIYVSFSMIFQDRYPIFFYWHWVIRFYVNYIRLYDPPFRQRVGSFTDQQMISYIYYRFDAYVWSVATRKRVAILNIPFIALFSVYLVVSNRLSIKVKGSPKRVILCRIAFDTLNLLSGFSWSFLIALDRVLVFQFELSHFLLFFLMTHPWNVH